MSLVLFFQTSFANESTKGRENLKINAPKSENKPFVLSLENNKHLKPTTARMQINYINDKINCLFYLYSIRTNVPLDAITAKMGEFNFIISYYLI